MKRKITLYRVGPGYYETSDGDWSIVRGEASSGWAGEWLARSNRDRSLYSDSYPTLAEAKLALLAFHEAEGVEAPVLVVKRDPRPYCPEHNVPLPCLFGSCASKG